MPENVGSIKPDQQKWKIDILNSASRILQCWSYYVIINSARHQHDTERTQNRAGLAIDSCFTLVGAHQYGVTTRKLWCKISAHSDLSSDPELPFLAICFPKQRACSQAIFCLQNLICLIVLTWFSNCCFSTFLTLRSCCLLFKFCLEASRDFVHSLCSTCFILTEQCKLYGDSKVPYMLISRPYSQSQKTFQALIWVKRESGVSCEVPQRYRTIES